MARFGRSFPAPHKQARLLPSAAASGTLKTVNGLNKTSIKTIQALAIASVKTYDGLTP